MNLKALFGTTFFSCLIAFALYDLAIKGAISAFTNKYDNTYERDKKIVIGRKPTISEARKKHLQNLVNGNERMDVIA